MATRRTRSPAFRRLTQELAARVRQLRHGKGWTQRELAGRVGVGLAVVQRIERAAGNPSLAVLVSLSRAMRVRLSALLSG